MNIAFKKPFLICLLGITAGNAYAQSKIKDGSISSTSSLPAAGSLLELESNHAGLRMPQVSLTNTTTWLPMLGSGAAATSPGMTVYNTNAGITSTDTVNYPALGAGEYYWDGTGWVVKNPVAVAAYIEPWYNVATNTGAKSNTQDIYQMGKVGIGTNTPGYAFDPFASTIKLDVLGGIRAGSNAGFPGIFSVLASNTPSSSPVFISLRSRGTLAAPTYVQNGDLLGEICFRNHNGKGSQISADATENHSAGTSGSDLSFWTIANGSNTPVTRMVIDNSGNVGIGTVAAPQGQLHVVGAIRAMPDGAYTGNLNLGTASNDGTELVNMPTNNYVSVQRSTVGANLYLTKDIGTGSNLNFEIFNRSGTTIGSISSPTGTAISFNTTSDIRLKEHIRPTHYSVEDVMKIRVADYNYISDAAKTTVTGFLAQDLYKVYPDAVTPGGEDPKTAPWTVDYSKMTPLLVKAMQDQQAEIEALKKQNAQLTTQQADMQSAMTELKAEIRSMKTENRAAGKAIVQQ